MSAALTARGLVVTAPAGVGEAVLVDRVDLDLESGETLALVGESGAGKTLTALALLGLVPPPARLAAGSVVLEGRELVGRPERELRRVRGAGIAYMPQDPAAALLPVRRVGAQVAETLRAHAPLSRAAARARAARALAEVGLPRDDLPHRLSGGQRQRALLALALAPGPRVLLADEPTAAVDALTTARVLALLDERRRARGLAMLLITHDLGAVARAAGRVAVMYAGRVVEEGTVAQVLRSPRHPYAMGLVACAPRLDRAGRRRRTPIPGRPPPPGARPPGCAFAPRCPARRAECDAAPPPLRAVEEGRRVACVLDAAEAAVVRSRTGAA